MFLSPRYREKIQLTACRTKLRFKLLTYRSEHFVKNLPQRIVCIAALGDSYLEGETIRLQQLRELLTKANRTVEKTLNHKDYFDEATLVGISTAYVKVVLRATELETIEDVTIHDRRCEQLF